MEGARSSSSGMRDPRPSTSSAQSRARRKITYTPLHNISDSESDVDDPRPKKVKKTREKGSGGEKKNFVFFSLCRLITPKPSFTEMAYLLYLRILIYFINL